MLTSPPANSFYMSVLVCVCVAVVLTAVGNKFCRIPFCDEMETGEFCYMLLTHVGLEKNSNKNQKVYSQPQFLLLTLILLYLIEIHA